VRAGGAEKYACGGKLTIGGSGLSWAAGWVPFWALARTEPVNVPRGTPGLWRIGKGGWLLDVPRGTKRQRKQRIGQLAKEWTDFQLKASNFQRFLQRFIFGDFWGFFSDFRRSVFGDQFAAIRFMLSYLGSNSRSFILRSTVSQFHSFTKWHGGAGSSFQS